ncbi:uncharacterized protein LOC124280603 [Haliotis rubra]|uniref:uncharacterized protein LOC124280603 n=1 Tax=Haliotis rubra TaxID=36100 RepID=UPI001EE590C9|nr:uncharacterized protein LOC124280603 [Haliotis rubra]
MNVLANNSDRQFLWMMASVSDGSKLTVACGKTIPPDGASSTQSTKSRLSIHTSSHNYMTSSYSKATSHYPRATRTTDIWTSSTGSMTTTATGLFGSVSSKGYEESTLMHLNSDSSSGLQFTTSSSLLLTTLRSTTGCRHNSPIAAHEKIVFTSTNVSIFTVYDRNTIAATDTLDHRRNTFCRTYIILDTPKSKVVFVLV